MSHIVWIDRTTHREVIMDYSGSPRHVALTKAEWQDEYANGAEYADMRTDQAGSVADVVPNVGGGLWKNDWSAPYVKPFEKLVIESDATPEFDGHPAVLADGAAKHTLTIKKVDEAGADIVAGAEPIRVFITTPITVSNMSPTLANGTVNIDAGPGTDKCDVVIEAKDPAGVIRDAVPLKIRFK